MLELRCDSAAARAESETIPGSDRREGFDDGKLSRSGPQRMLLGEDKSQHSPLSDFFPNRNE